MGHVFHGVCMHVCMCSKGYVCMYALHEVCMYVHAPWGMAYQSWYYYTYLLEMNHQRREQQSESPCPRQSRSSQGGKGRLLNMGGDEDGQAWSLLTDYRQTATTLVTDKRRHSQLTGQHCFWTWLLGYLCLWT